MWGVPARRAGLASLTIVLGHIVSSNVGVQLKESGSRNPELTTEFYNWQAAASSGVSPLPSEGICRGATDSQQGGSLLDSQKLRQFGHQFTVGFVSSMILPREDTCNSQ